MAGGMESLGYLDADNLRNRRIAVVIVNGFPRAGKDTAVRFMKEWAEEHGWKVCTHSTIDSVRQMLDQITEGRKGPAERKLLADVGTALEEYNGFRSNGVKQFVLQNLTFRVGQKGLVVFVHLREPALIQKVVESFPRKVKVVTLLVRNPLAEAAPQSNAADANVMDYAYQWFIVNNSTLGALMDNARATISEILQDVPADQPKA